MECTAAVWRGADRPLSIETLQLDTPKRGEVLVKVVATGVCHSDLNVANGSRPWPSPLVLGHEGAGIVEAVGDGVTRLVPGDHVVLSWMPYCGACVQCLTGHPNHCDLAKTTSYKGLMLDQTTRLQDSSGATVFSYLATASFANWSVVPESAAIKVRSDAPLDRIALVGCAVATGVGAVLNNAEVELNSTCLIIGCGGVGLSVVAGAKLAGASQIIAVDLNPNHLERARALGATALVNPHTQDILSEVHTLTGGVGVDYSFEAIGKPQTIEAAYASLAPRGRATVVGQVAKGAKISVDPYVMSDSELILSGSNYGATIPPRDFPMLVDLYMDGMLDLNQLVDRTIHISEINDALDRLSEGRAARAVILHEH